MAWRLGLTIQEYRELEADELRISFDLYERIVEVCGGPIEAERRGHPVNWRNGGDNPGLT
jgi:hypothetical protein